MSETTLEAARAAGLCSYCHNIPCACPPEAKEAHEALAEYKVTPEKSQLLTADQTTLERFTNPWAPDRRAFGALPHFAERDAIVEHFAEEAKYFGKHYQTGQGPEWRDPFYAEGDMLFELKFGKRLSEFAEEILAHYPPLGGKKGKEVSLFGLSGAGKSTVVEAVKEQLGDGTVVMDSDTVRFNLFAKMVKDVETTAGASVDEVRNQLIHNNISGSLYFLLNHVTKELRERGYNVVQASTQPTHGADVTIYIEHPDGIDPRTISDEQLPAVAKQLYDRTQNRVHGSDDFDWESGETITDFNKMENVTVQVPERVHNIFVKNVREALQKDTAGNIKTLRNPLNNDPVERQAALGTQIKELLGSENEGEKS